jgi:CubicO group peptidase (beta-lactamase class C family)
MAYEFTHPKLNAWREWTIASTSDGRSNARSSNIAVAHKVPLLFEPDEGWVYGYGIDWAGLAVIRATRQTLEQYMSKNIWGPCSMNSTTFSMTDHRPDLLPRFAGMTMRDESGKLVDLETDLFTSRAERVRYGGGGGCFSTANDYIKLLASLLRTITSSTNTSSQLPSLVSKSTLESMFSQRLSPTATTAINKTIYMPLASGLAGNIPEGTSTTFGLGGIINLDPLSSSARSPGAMQWSGLPNLFWWISPSDGLCGCYFTQILPPGDRTSLSLYSDFEAATLKEWREAGKGKL